MHGLRICAATLGLALGLSSYAWSAAPEDSLGSPAPDLSAAGPAKAARPKLARGASAVDPSVKRYVAALDGLAPQGASATRGANETLVYQAASQAVVLIVSDDSLGSGALVSADGLIVTNLHVVGDAKEVGVIFKPPSEGAQLDKKDIRTAKVVRRDGVADLALIKVAEVPAGVTPLKVAGSSAVQVGSDVHAIGHPTGEAWTYTRGIVSQIRRDYAWAAKDEVPHKATVIQTQTPINPGNSGGPLLDDALEIVGINSFKGEGEGLNFAVSAEDVKALLAMTADRAAEPSKACEIKELSSRPSKKPKGEEIVLDVDCDGVGDVLAVQPFDRREPITYASDEDGDGKLDTILVDSGQDGQLDLGLYDTDADGKVDTEGYFHPGEDKPYRYQKISK